MKKEIRTILILLIIWIITELLVYPVGEFPVNDDWSYTHSLENLYFHHELLLNGFTSMTLAAQLVWAELFCLVFGWSFLIIRISTITLGFIGIVAAYLSGKEITGNKKMAFIIGLLVAFNPIYLNLSNSFMTDVPFTSILFLSMYFFIYGLKNNNIKFILIGVIFCIIAILIRQLAIVLIVCFACAYCLNNRFNKKAVLISFFATAFAAVIYLAYNYWLKQSQGYPAMYAEVNTKIKNNLFAATATPFGFIVKQIFYLLIYAGFFVCPFAILFISRKNIGSKKIFLLIFAAIFCLTAAYCFWYKVTMPFSGNILSIYGQGITTLRDIQILQLPDLTALPVFIFVLITFFGITGAAFIIYAVLSFIKKIISVKALQQNPVEVFMLCFIILYSTIIILVNAFDRYYLPLIIPFCTLIFYAFNNKTASINKTFLRISFLLIAAYGFFSVNDVHNQFAWDRARWNALNYLTNDIKIPAAKIDGGFEFDGYYLYNNTMDYTDDPNRKSWWWVRDDAYLLSFGLVDHYSVFKTYAYKRFLNLSEGKVYILKRQE